MCKGKRAEKCREKINKEHLSQNIYESVYTAGNETDAEERGGKNGRERAARLELGCGGDGDYGDGGKRGTGGLSNSPSSLPSSTDVRLRAIQHFDSNCSRAEMKAIQSHDVVGWRQLHSHTSTCTPNTCTQSSLYDGISGCK